MGEEHLVSVVVLNYNAGELLLNCIKSIKEIYIQKFRDNCS